MRQLYLIIPGSKLTSDVAREVLAEGLDERQVRVFADRPSRLAVGAVPLKGLSAFPETLMPGALIGALAGLLGTLVVVTVGGAGPWAGWVLPAATLAGGVVGVVVAWRRSVPPELEPLRDELSRDDVVMVVDVPDQQLGPLEQSIKSRHPEVRVKGTDPSGSPPFP